MTSTKKKAAPAAKTKKADEKAYEKVLTAEVSKVRTLKSGDTFFDLKINGVTIYGCKAVETKDYPIFIGWPQRKGSDGNYYNVCSIYLSPEDTAKIIEKVQAELDKDDDEDDIPF